MRLTSPFPSQSNRRPPSFRPGRSPGSAAEPFLKDLSLLVVHDIAKGRGTSWYRVRINIAPSPLSLCLPSINCPIQRGRLPRRTNCSTEIGTRNNSCIADGRESLRDPYHRRLSPPPVGVDRCEEDRGESRKTTRHTQRERSEGSTFAH